MNSSPITRDRQKREVRHPRFLARHSYRRASKARAGLPRGFAPDFKPRDFPLGYILVHITRKETIMCIDKAQRYIYSNI